MKNNIKLIIGIIIGVLLSGITVYAATYLSKDATFSPSDENWNVNNVEDALNELYQNVNSITNNDEFYLQSLHADIRVNMGGQAGMKFNAENYNTLTIGSRTRDKVAGTTYWKIIAYSESDCTGDSTELLNSTSVSSEIETYNISEYKCVFLHINCAATGSSASWARYYFNDITLLK